MLINMSATVTKINRVFKCLTKVELDELLSKIVLSERQSKIFDMFYIQKKDIGFIADTLYVSVSVINCELRLIREKMMKVI